MSLSTTQDASSPLNVLQYYRLIGKKWYVQHFCHVTFDIDY